MKFVKFCQKPLLIIAAIVLGVFTLGLVITSVVPYAATTYHYSDDVTIMGYTVHMESDLKLSGDKYKVVTKTTYNGETHEETDEGYFKLEDGKLYMGETKENMVEFPDAKISAYEIVVDYGMGEMVYSNGFTKAMRVVDIVMMAVSGVALVASVVLIVLDKKGKLK